jgi:GT2 family glycosyltransferase
MIANHRLLVLTAFLLLLLGYAILARPEKDGRELDEEFSGIITPLQKKLAAASVATLIDVSSSLVSKQHRRRRYPESNPHVCLAFLSCCNRIDLLNHTLAAAIRHLEEDEPRTLRYEIAWVDNGSRQELVQSIIETYQIEHALPLEQNMGLATGMNLLMFQLCTAPYILLLEEDWLYLDDVVANQTKRRKQAIATSIALLEQGNMMAFDGRTVMGVFLRPETYSSFLHFPYADVWNNATVDLQQLMLSDKNWEHDESVCSDETKTTQTSPLEVVDYRIFCADTGLNSGAIWGSYTNGAGLYRRSSLRKVGRMYGEPGDAFHDSYVEANYAYRVGLQACHAAIRLNEDPTCVDIGRNCTAAFYHIGGGRGTRPKKPKTIKCGHFAWNFYDTPMYDKFVKYNSLIGTPVPECTPAELEEHRQVRFKQTEIEQYQAEVQEESKILIEMERAKRHQMREQAKAILIMNKDDVRQQVSWMSKMTDAEIDAGARRLIRLADSPHPLDGFWDSHGRPIK